MTCAADVLTLLRVALAPLFAWMLLGCGDGSVGPLGVFTLAAASDFFDGRLARARGGGSSAGRMFDHGADALFLFPGLFVLAWTHRLPAALPLAATAAFGGYLLDGWRNGNGAKTIELVPSRTGAAAGILNYAVAGLAAGAVWVGPGFLEVGLQASALVAVAVNGIAALERVRHLARPAVPQWAGER
jgi:cardiolipin synthase